MTGWKDRLKRLIPGTGFTVFEMVKFYFRIVAKIFLFQSVNFDYFLVENDYSLAILNYSNIHLQIYSLPLESQL